MAKGNEAKKNLINKLIAAVGPSVYLGEYDKKYYFWSEENGEQIQVAISMTCPKNPVAVIESDELNFEDINENKEIHPVKFEPAEITQEEKDKIAELIEKLGL